MKDLIITISILLLPVILILGIGLVVRQVEARLWNNGKCRRCQTPWKQFTIDSQGGRGYTCRGRHSLWITSSVDKVTRSK